MATPSCVLGSEEGVPVAPGALLGLAGAVLASLVAVTASKWSREAGRRRAAAERIPEPPSAGKKGKGKAYPEYTIDAVQSHSTAEDAWVVVGDGVFDVTQWAKRHPGGERNIVDISGRWVGGDVMRD